MPSDAQVTLKEIHKILREDWDPIGGVPDDEYDSYGAEIYSMFLDGKGTKENLVNYLQWGEGEHIGIDPDRTRNEKVAEKILSLFKKHPDNLGVFTTRQIANGEEQVLHVSHDKDGDWQFLPLATLNDEDASLIHLGHLLEWDASLNEVMDLPIGWHAYRRKVGDSWIREEWSDSE